MATSDDLMKDIRHLAGIVNVYEGKEIENDIRDKLREIVTAHKHRYKTKKPEDLADELEDLLKQASLQKPPALSPKQYQAVANVWQMLGDDIAEVEAAAGRALMLMSEGLEPAAEKNRLDEKSQAEMTKTLESIQRWLKGAFPTVNSYAKKMQEAAASGGADKNVQGEVQTISDPLQQMVTCLTRLDVTSKKVLGGKKTINNSSK